MNSKKKPLLIIGIIALAVIAYLAFNSNKTLDTPINTEQDLSENADETQDKSEEILALLSSGGSYECYVEQTLEGGIDTSGNIFVSGMQMRGEYVAETPAGPMTTSVLSDGQFAYTWSDIMNGAGFMVPLSIMETSPDQPLTVETVLESQFQGVTSYSCDPWSPEDPFTFFVAPSNIEFTDLTKEVPTAPEQALQ